MLYQFMILILILSGIGCNNSQPAAEQHTSTEAAQSSPWPNCLTPTGNYGAPSTMSDSMNKCSSCELVSPCNILNPGNLSVSYHWYSAKICNLCANSCPHGSDVKDFCNTYFTGQCNISNTNSDGQPIKYICGLSPGYFYLATTYAAFGKTTANINAWCGGSYDQNDSLHYYPTCPFK